MLFLFGVAGILGNFAAGARAPLAPFRALFFIAATMSVSMLALPATGAFQVGEVITLVSWGVAYGGLPVTFQNLILKAAPEAIEPATSLHVAVFNASIALGSLLGGGIVDTTGPSGVMPFGGLLTLVMLIALRIRQGNDAVVSRTQV